MLQHPYRYVDLSNMNPTELTMIRSGKEIPHASSPAELFLSDDIFHIEDGCVSLIARVHLPRSVKSFVVVGSVALFEVCFTSEFHDPVDIIVEPSRLMAAFLKCYRQSPTASHIREACLSAFEVPLIDSKKKSMHFKIKFPDKVDRYRLYLFLHQKSPKDTAIITLPLLTDSFNVVSEHTMTLQSDVAPLLSCFRFIDGVIIEEEYGRTMGSHIYDCSVAILRYFRMLYTLDKMSEGESCKGMRQKVAVELGAGCGLVSIWLSKQLHAGRVIATDVSCQTPLLVRNIVVNKAQDTCTAKALDWALFAPKNSRADITRKDESPPFDASEESTKCNVTDEKEKDGNIPIVRDKFDSPPPNRCKLLKYHLGIEDGEYLDMIFAGDVLYAKSLANDFFNVIKAFAVPNETSIIVAQRLRNSDERDTFDVRSIPGLTCEVIWEEAKVVIWKIHVIP